MDSINGITIKQGVTFYAIFWDDCDMKYYSIPLMFDRNNTNPLYQPGALMCRALVEERFERWLSISKVEHDAYSVGYTLEDAIQNLRNKASDKLEAQIKEMDNMTFAV